MAAAQNPGTPAPAQADVTAPPETAMGGEVSSKGADEQSAPEDDRPLAGKDFVQKMAEARKAKKAREASAGENAEAEPEAKPDKPAEKKLDDITAEVFSDQALATPEGVKRAGELLLFGKDALEKRHRKLDSFAMGLKQDKKKFAERSAAVESQAATVARVGGILKEGLAIITGARQAAPLVICETLDRLAGGRGDAQAGRDLLEQMILAMGRDGEAPKETARERQWRERIERMELDRKQEREQWQSQQEEAEVSRLEQNIAARELHIGNSAVSNPGHFPAIASWVAAGRTSAAAIGKWCGDLMQDYARNGQPLDMAQAIGILEENLTLPGVGRAAQAETGGGRQQSTASQPRTKSSAKQSTVLPSDADASLGGRKKETTDERRARVARDPEIAKRLGPIFTNALRD